MRISDWSSDVCSSDLLRLGRFAEGWAGYHYRRKPVVEVRNPDGAPLPEWSGAPLAGQRLLLWCEQGIGDQIMFLSLVPHLLRQGARLALVIEDRMLPLVRRSFPQVDVIAERIIVADPQLPVTMDAWTFLGDLPRHLSLFCGGTAAPEAWLRPDRQIGRAHVCTPVTNAHLVCRLLL